jgi:hypothetical protein
MPVSGSSGLVEIRRVNRELERPAVTQSNCGEVAHVARRETTNAEGLRERHD